MSQIKRTTPVPAAASTASTASSDVPSGEGDAAGKSAVPALIVEALGQSEMVKEKVEQCAVDLSAVNEVLQLDAATGAAQQEVKDAIVQNAVVEARVQECVDDLAVINEVLVEEIAERHSLGQELAATSAALLHSQAVADAAVHRSLHDPLTGLPNATLFTDRLELALLQARRRSWGLAVMFIDLDQFKAINDSHGHAAGDALLKIMAARLRALVRGGDSIGRRSGDEFLFLMLDSDGEDTVLRMAQRVIARLAEDCVVGDVILQVRPSIGIARFPEHGRTAEQLLANADSAMYAAKRTAEGYVLYSSTPAD